MPGWDSGSWGYHGDDGGLFSQDGDSPAGDAETYGTGDVIGCGITTSTGMIFFTKNGRRLGKSRYCAQCSVYMLTVLKGVL